MTNPLFATVLDDNLCRLATGYTRKELLNFKEEDTGLEQAEVASELKDIDRYKQTITKAVEQLVLDIVGPQHDWYLNIDDPTAAALYRLQVQKRQRLEAALLGKGN